MSSFAPRPGCPLCGIVASAANSADDPLPPLSLPPGPSNLSQPQVLWRDKNVTAYREKANPVSSKGHIIITFNLHVPSIYTLSSSDLPLLVSVRDLAARLLSSLSSPSDRLSAVPSSASESFHIGFITPPFKDNKIPVTDHLHAHAYIAPADLMGWWRGIAYGPLAWYAIDDLIAEIRESVSNNRIKSGYQNRTNAPIDRVPGAGARSGTADGIETSEPTLAHSEPQDDRTPGSSTLASPRSSTTSIPI